MRLFIVLVVGLLIVSGNVESTETQFKVGQKYHDIIGLIKDGVKMSIPLPKGEWIVTGIGERPTGRAGGSSTAASFGSRLVDVYLNKIENNVVTGGVTIRYPLDNDVRGWAAPSVCRREARNYVEEKAWYNGTQTDCWVVSFQPATTNKAGSAFYRSIQYVQNLGAKFPTLFIYSLFYRADYSEFLRVGYAVNPESEGVSALENSGSFRTADYHPNRINQYPDKKAFMDKFISFNRSWKKFIDQGFEGNLNVADIRRSRTK